MTVERRPAALAGLLLLTIALVAGVSASWWQNRQPRSPEFEALLWLEQPRSLSAVELIDQDGQPFETKDFSGRWNLLFFGFTHCPDICPDTLYRLQAVTAALDPSDAERLRTVFVSVDPGRDTPALLKPYVEYFGSEVTGLTGTPDAIAELARDCGIAHSVSEADAEGRYAVDHSAALVLVGPQAKIRGYFSAPHDIAQLSADIRKVLQIKETSG